MEPMKLAYDELKCITKQQLTEHYEVLYKGYVNKINDIRAKITATSPEGANGTYADIRELKLEESFALNGVKLHEAYFLGMGGDGQAPKDVEVAIVKDFGSYQAWLDEFIATGMSARGWAVLCYDWREMRLRNILADWHSHGAIWNCTPVLVLDVYEHAYFMDYGTKRRAYIDAWLANISWDYAKKTLDFIARQRVS
jgi:superoxide dismutase, Fe-Mn family